MQKIKGPYEKMRCLQAYGINLLAEIDQEASEESPESKKCKNEIKKRWQLEQEFCDSVQQQYQSLCEQINMDDVDNIFMELVEFVPKAKEAEQRLDTIQRNIEELKEKFKDTPQSRLARSLIRPENLLKNECLPACNEIPEGLSIYKLPVKTAYADQNKKIRRFVMLNPENLDETKSRKVIMMVGMTGSGKSLMINNLLNYIYGVQYRDNFRLKLIVDEEEINEREGGEANHGKASSMTSWVTGFDLDWMPGFRADFNFTLIDTPGFADSKGVAEDEKIIDRIRAFFNDEKACPDQEVSSIGFVIQSACSRLTDEQRYIFDQVLNLFGKDMSENVTMLFTFADAQKPPALECVKSHQIPYADFFKFNNSALFAPNPENSHSALAWDFGYGSVEQFFNHLLKITPTSLTQTKVVLDERERLKILLQSLKLKIDEGMYKLKSIEAMIDQISSLKGTMQSNKNYKVQKSIERQVTEYVNYSITNCTTCMFTCHPKCAISGDIKNGCAVMSNGMCEVCPGKCPYDTHKNGNKTYKYIPDTVEETVDDMLKIFRIASSDKDAKKKLLEGLLENYRVYKQSVFDNIMTAAETTNRLDEIAMRNTYLTNVDYIKRLIEAERRGNKPHKENRLQQLQNMLEMAEILSAAKNNPEKLTEHMSDYEKTVIERIEKLGESEVSENKKKWFGVTQPFF